MADVKDAIDFMNDVTDAETIIRNHALEDAKFRYGDQWPNYAVAARGLDRPQLTINETDGYCRQVINNIRQQRPRMNPHPTGAGGSIEVSKVIKGLLRHIEVNSGADNAYDTAADWAVTTGTGYFRIVNDYTREDSFDQDLYIRAIYNPFSVYFDPNSMAPDGSDASQALITDLMSKGAFQKQYPGAAMASITQRGTGDEDPDWVTRDDIRLAEYMYVDRSRARLVKLSDGRVMYDDALPKAIEAHEIAQALMPVMQRTPLMVVGDRQSFKRVVKWQKQTAFEILDERDLPFRYIPVVPVYGVRTFLEGKRDRMGLVRFAKDPQVMINFWQTTITEALALAPKAKWLMAEGQDENHENEWAHANISTAPVLRFKSTDIDGKPFIPQRIQPEQPPVGAFEAAFMASQNMQRVVGMFDPEMQRGTDPKSGKAIRQERMQSDNSNFHFYDNLTGSLMHAGRICLSGFPAIFDTQRVQRIIGDDGRPKLTTINEKQLDQAGAVVKVLNDVRVGEYDIVMETGPGYDTKRQEAAEYMMQLLATPLGEKVAQVGDDLIVRNMDFSGADALADRLAAANPFSQVDQMGEIPPEQLKIRLAGAQMQLQQAQKVIQDQGLQLKYRGDIEQMRQAGETRREHMRSVTKAHDINERNLSMQHSVETKAVSAQNVAEINAFAKILTDQVGLSHESMLAVMDHVIQLRDMELQQKTAENASAQP